MDTTKYPITMGNDRLLRRGEQLVICSKIDMDDWRIQQTRKTGISINGDIWCLVEKRYTQTKEVRYLLEPWPDLIKEIPGRIVHYNEAYVQARNEAERKRKLEAGAGPILYRLRGLTGFLPSRLKAKMEADFGVPSRNATFLSILIETFLFLGLGAVLQVFVYATMRVPDLVINIPVLIVLILVLFPDMVMRYHSYLREDRSPWGFYEWAVRWKKPRKPIPPR